MQDLKGRQLSGQARKPGGEQSPDRARRQRPSDEGIIDLELRRIEKESALGEKDLQMLRSLAEHGGSIGRMESPTEKPKVVRGREIINHITRIKNVLRCAEVIEDGISARIQDSNSRPVDIDRIRETLCAVAEYGSVIRLKASGDSHPSFCAYMLYCSGDEAQGMVNRRFLLTNAPAEELFEIAPELKRCIKEKERISLAGGPAALRYLYLATAETESALEEPCRVFYNTLGIEPEDLKRRRHAYGKGDPRAADARQRFGGYVVVLVHEDPEKNGMKLLLTTENPARLAESEDNMKDLVTSSCLGIWETVKGVERKIYYVLMRQGDEKEAVAASEESEAPTCGETATRATAEEDAHVLLKRLIEEAYRAVENIAEEIRVGIDGEVREEITDGKGGIAVFVSSGRQHYIVTNMDTTEACGGIGKQLTAGAESQNFILTEINAAIEPRLVELSSGGKATIRIKPVGLLVLDREGTEQADTLEGAYIYPQSLMVTATPANVEDMEKLLVEAAVDATVEGDETEGKQRFLTTLSGALAGVKSREETGGSYSEAEDIGGNAYAVFRIGKNQDAAGTLVFAGTMGTITFTATRDGDRIWYMLVLKEFLTPYMKELLFSTGWPGRA